MFIHHFGGHFDFFYTRFEFDLWDNIKIRFPDPKNLDLDTKIVSLSQFVKKLELDYV